MSELYKENPIIIKNLTKSKANIVLDASKIDLFETCPARYNYRHNLNKGLQKKAEALEKGGLAHEGLEVYFNLLKQGVSYVARMERALMKIRERSSDVDYSSLDPDDINILIDAIEQSCDYWRAEDENSLEILAVEQAFAYILYEDEHVRIIISGKIDLLVNYNAIGRGASYTNLPIDHKSFSRESLTLRKSNQFINYAAATGSNYLVVNKIGLQKTLKAEDKFKRLPLSYDPIYIADWKNNLTHLILDEYLGCVAEDYWPEKPTSCFKFNRICEYYDICDSSGAEAKAFKLESNYVDGEKWDVTKALNSGE